MSVSTHVLDNAAGSPAPGVPVRLERDGSVVDAGVTDADGRLRFARTLTPGRYRLVFDTAAHLGPGAFFPEACVVFQVTNPDRHLHLPLLLSPFGYTTYRGS
ncbi:MAG TPA: hydroxyisourate hydrolase [Rugosimonospora sp.]|nr:hydroxyisourate hydrolase [Rugosimonospora sp.]